MFEKKKDFANAMEGYLICLAECGTASEESIAFNKDMAEGRISSRSREEMELLQQRFELMQELSGEVMLRIAVLRKEMGALDQSMQMCNKVAAENFSDAIRANALCLKVCVCLCVFALASCKYIHTSRSLCMCTDVCLHIYMPLVPPPSPPKGLLHEMRAEFPSSEVVYRSALQIMGGHSTALERLGRVYLRYRETIPAAVQCFFKSVETNPSNHVAWYLLGRCYMATAQYTDACEAYNRAVNLNPNDPQVWCSLGVLYYAFGQYREALGMLSRALKLDPTMADAWYNVGALYDMCDQPEDAQQAYMKARENGLADRFSRAGMGLDPLGVPYGGHQQSQQQHDQNHQQQEQQQQQAARDQHARIARESLQQQQYGARMEESTQSNQHHQQHLKRGREVGSSDSGHSDMSDRQQASMHAQQGPHSLHRHEEHDDMIDDDQLGDIISQVDDDDDTDAAVHAYMTSRDHGHEEHHSDFVH